METDAGLVCQARRGLRPGKPAAPGVLPKSICKDEFHESLIFIPRFPEGNGDSRSSSLQRIGVFLLRQHAPVRIR